MSQVRPPAEAVTMLRNEWGHPPVSNDGHGRTVRGRAMARLNVAFPFRIDFLQGFPA
jgi:hypothetical protein